MRPGKKALTLLILLSLASVGLAQESVTRHIDFEIRFSGGRSVDRGDLSDLYGIYNLVENQRYANRVADFYQDSSTRGFANAQLAFGLANIVMGQFEKASYTEPAPKPAKVRFEVTMWEKDPGQPEDGLEVRLRIRNIGWQELQFDRLDRHFFLLDREGFPVALGDSESALDKTLRPGESTEGLVWFPAAELGGRVKFIFEDILGKEGQLTLRR